MSSNSSLSEVRLWSNAKDLEKYENLADLYAILKCTEKLERAYVRDGVTAKDYEAQCEKLIAQFRMLWGSMKQTVPSIESFIPVSHAVSHGLH
jgi:ESCRT-I complex subunit VPS28